MKAALLGLLLLAAPDSIEALLEKAKGGDEAARAARTPGGYRLKNRRALAVEAAATASGVSPRAFAMARTTYGR